MRFNDKVCLQEALQVICILSCIAVQLGAVEAMGQSSLQVQRSNLQKVTSSPEVHHLADRILETHDNQNLPFVVLDKKYAKVFVFNSKGQLRGAAPALIGLAIGDEAVEGIGNRLLSSILREEKTTPAGRFIANLDVNLSGHQILWVNYETSISLHSVVTNDPTEHRVERLESRSIEDNRISYGCINVSTDFFQNVVIPAFKGTSGIVYILPDQLAIQDVFLFYEP